MYHKGFSLIELLISCTILVIITSFAYASYFNHLLHSRRHDGQLALLDLANRLEHFYAEQHSYESATLGLGKPTDIKDDNLSAEKWYSLKIVSQSTDSFNLQAIPRNAQMKDRECQTLTLDHLGTQGITIGPAGSPTAVVSQCW